MNVFGKLDTYLQSAENKKYLTVYTDHLCVLGFWQPYKNGWKKFLYTVYSTFTKLLMASFCIPHVISVYNMRHSLHLLCFNLCITSFVINALVKLYTFNKNKESFLKIQQDLFNFSKTSLFNKHEEHLKIIQEVQQGSFLIIKICYALVVVILLLWLLKPFFDGAETRNLPFSVWFPFNMDTSPNYQLLYCWQIYTSFPYATFTLVYTLLFQTICLYTYGFCKILHHNLENWNSVMNGSANEILKENLVFHQTILKHLEEYDKLFGMSTLIQISASTLLMCFVGFDITVSKEFNMRTTALMGFGFNILIEIWLFCFCGGLVTSEIEKASFAAYSIPWYELPLNTRRNLIVFMAEVQRPRKLKAGKVFPLNLETLLSLINMSFSMMAFFRQLVK